MQMNDMNKKSINGQNESLKRQSVLKTAPKTLASPK